MDVLLLFPHQLFDSNVALARGKQVLLVEDPLFFTQYAFHQQKLVLHRAAMKAHQALLEKRGASVHYLDVDAGSTMAKVMGYAGELGARCVHLIDPVDDWVERRVVRDAKKVNLSLVRHESPMFLTSPSEIGQFFAGRPRMFMADFYAHQRRRLDVLMDGERPVGGKWSFDAENRKKLPKGISIPPLWRPRENAYVRSARDFVARRFPDNPGTADEFDYPVTSADARRWLADFVEHRLPSFGAYEDAMSTRDSALFHSVLTPMLNIGLLTPREVLDAVLAADGVPLNSREGFVRQLIGWREFMRAAYLLKGRQQRTRNFWGHERALPSAFWTARTGIAPLDATISRVLKHAYAHHIERLMLLGNFMQLCGFRPDDVYRWFMELFIDAYDWVMVPNVYGMALYADGGMISTKPYVAGSNYVRKMSDFPRGDWCDTWDGLFWTFIADHREVFESNVRIGPIVRQIERLSPDKLRSHRENARRFLAAHENGGHMSM